MIAWIVTKIMERFAPPAAYDAMLWPSDWLADVEADHDSWEARECPVSAGSAAPAAPSGGAPPSPVGAPGHPHDDEIEALVAEYRRFLDWCFGK